MQVVSGVEFHSAHCIMSLKYITLSSIWASVLSGTWRESEDGSYEVAKIVPVSFIVA
jgi:hypothetical protein